MGRRSATQYFQASKCAPGPKPMRTRSWRARAVLQSTVNGLSPLPRSRLCRACASCVRPIRLQYSLFVVTVRAVQPSTGPSRIRKSRT